MFRAIGREGTVMGLHSGKRDRVCLRNHYPTKTGAAICDDFILEVPRDFAGFPRSRQPFLSYVIRSAHWSEQATGLDAWASRVKCPARFMSHLHEICIYMWVVYSLCFFCCLFITVAWWYVWCFEWASGNQEEVQACLVTLWLFIISCSSLYKTTLGLLCSWFENNPHFHKYSMDFHV